MCISANQWLLAAGQLPAPVCEVEVNTPMDAKASEAFSPSQMNTGLLCSLASSTSLKR